MNPAIYNNATIGSVSYYLKVHCQKMSRKFYFRAIHYNNTATVHSVDDSPFF